MIKKFKLWVLYGLYHYHLNAFNELLRKSRFCLDRKEPYISCYYTDKAGKHSNKASVMRELIKREEP